MKLACMAALLVCASGAHADLSWEIKHRFPLIHESAFKALADQVKGDPQGLEMRISTVRFRDTVAHLAKEPKERQNAWDVDAQIYGKRILSSQAQILAASDLGDGNCNWTLLNQATGFNLSAPGRCSLSPELPVELNQKYELAVTRGADGMQQRADITPKSHLIVVVGDSFASGEGNPDYPAVMSNGSPVPPFDWALYKGAPNKVKLIDAEWLDTACHRSLFSWSAVYAMREALLRKDTVVQYVSFACSGAEVIDGFFFAQKNPPGHAGVSLTQRKDTHLKFSQQEAMARLLCPNPPTSRRIDGLLDLRNWFSRLGESSRSVTVYACSKPVQPDEILVQFGGNDTFFSGIVKYVFHPPPLGYKFPGIGALVNQALVTALKPVDPSIARSNIYLLPQVYALLQAGLQPFIAPQKTTVRMMKYPDPTATQLMGNEAKSELELCKGRTQDGNRPIQKVIANILGETDKRFKHDSAWYGISKDKLQKIGPDYIMPLRNAQVTAARCNGWGLIEPQAAFDNRGLCAGSVECVAAGENCPNADRVRWAYFKRDGKNVMSKQTPPWEKIGDFNGYDPQQYRGIRYANDALLVGARSDPSGQHILLDWVFGMAHPTSAAHARVAAQVKAPLSSAWNIAPRALTLPGCPAVDGG